MAGPSVPRHRARERALSVLYEAEMKGMTPTVALEVQTVAPDDYARWLVQQVEKEQAKLDQLIGDAAIGWPLERLAVIDRLVLRLAVAELLDPTGPPMAVIIDEAVELAKGYSTEESGGFVNGILSTLAAELREGT